MENFFTIEDSAANNRRVEDWSFSKRTVLSQCPRKYYYSYFGANPRTALTELLKSKLQELKALSNVHLRSGGILDLVIRTYFRKAMSGDRWGVNRLERWATSMFRGDRDFNRWPETGQVTNRFPPVRLLEYYHGFSDAEAQYERAEEKLVTAIRNFFQSPEYTAYHDLGASAKSRIQQRVQFPIDGANARGKLDLAFPQPHGFQIVDWKIGADSGADETLQVGFYGLWASEQPELQHPIRLTMAYLGEGTAKHFELQDIRSRSIKARIIQDLNIMRTLQPFGITANAAAFTPCAQPRICQQCPFQSVCPKKE